MGTAIVRVGYLSHPGSFHSARWIEFAGMVANTDQLCVHLW